MELNEYLKQVFLFDDLSNEQIHKLASFISIRKVAKGELIFSEDQFASAFFAIISGKLKIFKVSTEGSEHTLEIHGPGDLVAEAAIFDRETYPAYCQAMEKSVLVRIPKEDFIQMIMGNPEIAIRIMHAYSKRLRYFVSMVEDLSLHDIKTRLAKYILKHLVCEDNKNYCRLTISKKELAAVLGTIPETLSRTLGNFKKKGIIKEEKDTIIVLNLPMLKSLI